MSMIAEPGVSRAGDDDSPDEAERLVREIHRLMRDSVQPYRAPTSDEICERASQVARMAPRLNEAGFTDEEISQLMRVMLARVIEARLSERITDTLSHLSVSFRSGRTKGFGGHFSRFALTDG
jgi:hypothetical protein